MNISIPTYQSEDAPAHRRWLALIVIRDSATMVFRAPTQEAARQAAQDFWNGELAKEQAKADAAAKRAERRKGRVAA
ncbi:hypothetical protein [Pelagibacterium sp. H642]|uniref:hypothetical protein n=1 Tax=Pelagibacterium sp. H642 TaxID=1881069 RepID=UPI0028150CE2|nr:hypothetical protein [Pelagibacterium sp. H642]WMT90111.1 hypothetical protein NO934_15130 [Pelagibacterium sp. H642]